MTDNDKQRPTEFAGENAQTAGLAPENENREQNDEPAQAQTLADEALRLHRDAFGPLTLTGVQEGRWRELNEAEVGALEALCTR